MMQPPFPSTSEAQLRNVPFLTKKPWSENSTKTTVTRAHVLRQGSACARGGRGGLPPKKPNWVFLPACLTNYPSDLLPNGLTIGLIDRL